MDKNVKKLVGQMAGHVETIILWLGFGGLVIWSGEWIWGLSVVFLVWIGRAMVSAYWKTRWEQMEAEIDTMVQQIKKEQTHDHN